MTPEHPGAGTSNRPIAFVASAIAVGALLYILNRTVFVLTAIAVQDDHSGLWSRYGSELSVATVVWTCLLVPVVEEYLFRKTLFRLFLRVSSIPVATIAASCVFSLAHVEAFGTPTMLCLVVAGLVYQTQFVRTGELFSPIISHATSNLLVLLPKPPMSDLISVVGVDGQSGQLGVLLLAGVIAAAAIFWMLRPGTHLAPGETQSHTRPEVP
jgi:membrane protease YdiL (CAAX protease family)